MEELAKDPKRPVTEHDIRQIHAFVLRGIDDGNAGKYRDVDVEISGSAFRPPGPVQVAMQMEEFAQWLGGVSAPEEPGDVEGLIVAAAAHTWLVNVHPFVDGNGRVARLLMNLILMRFGFPIAIITREDRLRYYDALEESQTSDLSSFLFLVAESIEESMEEYERATELQRERLEWVRSLTDRFEATERIRYENEYEVWKSAMDLLKSHFRHTVDLLDEESRVGGVHLRDFGTLEFEKYLSLRQHESAKKTWFFRIDFRMGDFTVRYLFFFGFPSPALQGKVDVTLHVAREDKAGSFYYERLDHLNPEQVPSVREIGYVPKDEGFIVREGGVPTRLVNLDQTVRKFFDDVVSLHFSG